jgi:hypothetical protein
VRTWHFETAVVAAVLLVVALASGGGVLELVGAGAVLLSFGHASVADRLAEAERERRAYVKLDGDTDKHAVECHRWATRYLVGKEALWLVYFVALGAWSALAGVALFLAYPVWRRWWRRLHPLGGGRHFNRGGVSRTPETQKEEHEHHDG